MGKLTSKMTLLFSVGAVFAGQTLAQDHSDRVRLRFENDFQDPEKVVEYYCARDASGFVWSGLLQSEILAFTTWDEPPHQDSFYIAKNYKILPARIVGHNRNHVTVEVRYEISAMGDANGTRMPASEKDYRVTFDLRKVNGAWKINHPPAENLNPVILESNRAPGPVPSPLP